jgi:hypothetical protein
MPGITPHRSRHARHNRRNLRHASPRELFRAIDEHDVLQYLTTVDGILVEEVADGKMALCRCSIGKIENAEKQNDEREQPASLVSKSTLITSVP